MLLSPLGLTLACASLVLLSGGGLSRRYPAPPHRLALALRRLDKVRS